jgi:peptidoglycan/xylan/chitin deacetylase (PgdA/CDA1 family)
MKFNNFLSLISFLIVTNACASFDQENLSLYWGNGKLEHKSDFTQVTTSTDDNYFIIADVEDLNLNLAEDNFYFKFKVDDIENFHGLEIRFSKKKNSESYYSYTLPYFTDSDFNSFKPGKWSDYGLSTANLKPVNKPSEQIDYVSFFLFTKKKPMTFSVKDLSKKKKPDSGVVSMTFDDGYKSQLLAGKIMKKYNLKGTAYIMPRNIGDVGLMPGTEIAQLKSFGWDIQSHHAIPLTTMKKEELKKELEFGLDYLEKNKFKSSSQHLAYPLGRHNDQIVSETQTHFQTARLAGGGTETLPPADLYRIRTFNVLDTTTPEQIKEEIEKAKSYKQWLILMFHYLNEKPETNLQYTPKNFETLCKYLKESGVSVLTIDETYRKYLK